MGLTQHSFDLFNRWCHPPASIIELGNQIIYFGSEYGKPAKPMFQNMGYEHTSIDMNEKDGAKKYDLNKIKPFARFDIITDFGTSEHVKNFYMAWVNKHHFTEINGVIINENPKVDNWHGHGFHYVTIDFYKELTGLGLYEILEIGEHPAMGNSKDGWNIYCVLKKTNFDFITQKQFNKLSFQTIRDDFHSRQQF